MDQITKEKIYMIFPAVLLAIIAILIYLRFVHVIDTKAPNNEQLPQLMVPLLFHPDKDLTNGIFDGHVGLIVFWQSDCEKCKEQHELLMYIANSHLVPIYGIDYEDSPSKAKAYLESQGNPYQAIAVDSSGRVGLLLNLQSIPETYVVDKTGRIRDMVPGPLTPIIWFDRVKPEIEKLKSE